MKSPVDFYLIRGLGREARHWGDFPSLLESQDYCSKVYCVDLPGAGKYSQLSSPLTIHETAQFVISQIDNDNQKVLVAVSLGAMVAAEVLHIKPDLFNRCYLMNTSFKNLSPFYHRLQLSGFKQFARIFAQGGDIEKRELEVLKMVSQREDRWHEISEQWAEIAMSNPMKPKNFLRQLIAAGTYNVPLDAPKAPVVVMNALGDEMVHPSCSQKLSEAWGTPLVSHPTAGHDICIDDPDWVLKTMAIHEPKD